MSVGEFLMLRQKLATAAVERTWPNVESLKMLFTPQLEAHENEHVSHRLARIRIVDQGPFIRG